MLHGLLAWYDEPLHDLQRMIRSCVGVVDHLIAVDGPYQTFPHERTRSDASQAAMIRATAEAAGMPCTILQPGIAWKNEGYKRTAMFELATQHGTIGEDWVLPIDADEELANPEQLVEYLAGVPTEHRAASFWYHTVPRDDISDAEMVLLKAGTEMRGYEQIRLIRLVPGLQVCQPTHSVFRDAVHLIQSAEYSFPADGFHVKHHTLHRTLERIRAKADHVIARNGRGES